MPRFRATVWFTENGIVQRRIVEYESTDSERFKLEVANRINKSLLDISFGPITYKIERLSNGETKTYP